MGEVGEVGEVGSVGEVGEVGVECEMVVVEHGFPLLRAFRRSASDRTMRRRLRKRCVEREEGVGREGVEVEGLHSQGVVGDKTPWVGDEFRYAGGMASHIIHH